jgi:ribosomal protein L17
MDSITKKELQDIVNGNTEFATRARVELLKDTSTDLFKKLYSEEVSTTEQIPLTKEQAKTVEKYSEEMIEKWANNK